MDTHDICHFLPTHTILGSIFLGGVGAAIWEKCECEWIMHIDNLTNHGRSVYGEKPEAGRDCGAGRDPYLPPNNSQVIILFDT